MIKDRLQIARGSAARITSFLNSFRDYEIIFNTDTNRLGIVLPDKTIVYIGALDINDAFEEGTYIESIEVDSESPNVLNIIRKPIPNPDLELNDNTETSGKYISKIEVDGTNKHKLNITKKDLPQGFSGDYNDLTNKPTIPTKTSDLSNDSGFLTTLPTHNHHDKADLVDGKVPLEQLPDIEITKQKVEDVLTGDITSHNHTTEISNHNTSETAHSDIRQKANEAKAIAEGKSRARVFATKSALDTWLLDSENVALLQIGDNFYIEETDKPDYWWNGTTIKELETQKVDLTDYAKTIDLPTKVSDLENDSEFLTEDDLPTIPTIPDITVNNGSAESGKYISAIAVDSTNKHKLNITKENLPTGFSGNYNDLTNKPTIPTKTSDLTNDSGYITGGDLPTLATVATSGSYNDLTDKPTIPTNTVSSTTITTIVSCTQAEYDALTPDANTLYVITD